MSDKPLSTQPLSGRESILKEKFTESIVAQNEQMDKLGQQLITLELAIPGLYATVLKLVSGDQAIVAVTPLLYLTFACWFVALLLTLISLIPKNWEVDPDILKQDPTIKSEVLGIEDFFYKTAQYKRRLLIASSLLFFVGVISAAFTIF